jgi:hypothetical protein
MNLCFHTRAISEKTPARRGRNPKPMNPEIPPIPRILWGGRVDDSSRTALQKRITTQFQDKTNMIGVNNLVTLGTPVQDDHSPFSSL